MGTELASERDDSHPNAIYSLTTPYCPQWQKMIIARAEGTNLPISDLIGTELRHGDTVVRILRDGY